ncbi:MAG: precorrin-3B C(17)-methyltransferase [Caloramator sp.]|nr:precorrin-3B C(17)-methyltransferase [Caloramator sp.]
MAKLYIVGIGPGGIEHMTLKALKTIEKCSVVVGYEFYINLIEDVIKDKVIIKSGMKEEIKRCNIAIEKVKEGFDTCIISTGDAGLYGMAGPCLELLSGIEFEIIPGVTSALCGAALVGAPIMHDFCTISLSDLLTPWEVIEKRLICAGEGDFVIAIYNPKSHNRRDNIKKAIEILLKYKREDTPTAIIKNAGRDGEKYIITTLKEIDFDFIDMMTVVIIGNSQTYIKNDFIITPRGYNL